MYVISRLTDETNKTTEDLSLEGERLLKIAEDTLKMSQEGKIAIVKMVEIIQKSQLKLYRKG